MVDKSDIKGTFIMKYVNQKDRSPNGRTDTPVGRPILILNILVVYFELPKNAIE